MFCLVILTTLRRFIFIPDIPVYITLLWSVDAKKEFKSKNLSWGYNSPFIPISSQNKPYLKRSDPHKQYYPISSLQKYPNFTLNFGLNLRYLLAISFSLPYGCIQIRILKNHLYSDFTVYDSIKWKYCWFYCLPVYYPAETIREQK